MGVLRASWRSVAFATAVIAASSAWVLFRGIDRAPFHGDESGWISSGMYYSVYFRGGYATHGYHSVPTYPASHGCVRNPISQSVFIYNWVRLGMSVYVYG